MAYAPGTDVGTPKALSSTITALNDNPSGAAVTTVTVVGLPAGTKAIAGRMSILGTAVEDYFTIDIKGAASGNRDILRVKVAGAYDDGRFFVPLNSSYQFDSYASSANIAVRTILVLEYYL